MLLSFLYEWFSMVSNHGERNGQSLTNYTANLYHCKLAIPNEIKAMHERYRKRYKVNVFVCDFAFWVSICRWITLLGWLLWPILPLIDFSHRVIEFPVSIRLSGCNHKKAMMTPIRLPFYLVWAQLKLISSEPDVYFANCIYTLCVFTLYHSYIYIYISRCYLYTSNHS